MFCPVSCRLILVLEFFDPFGKFAKLVSTRAMASSGVMSPAKETFKVLVVNCCFEKDLMSFTVILSTLFKVP